MWLIWDAAGLPRRAHGACAFAIMKQRACGRKHGGAAAPAEALRGCAVGRPTSFLFVDGVMLASRAAAVLIGGDARADISSLVLQNLAIRPSRRRAPAAGRPVRRPRPNRRGAGAERRRAACRGLAIQLRDEGHISAVQVTNVTMEVQFYDGDGAGGGEPIHVTALPRTTLTKVPPPPRAGVQDRVRVAGCARKPRKRPTWRATRGAAPQVGAVRNVAFVNVSAQAEAGAVIAGSEESTIDALSLEGVRLELRRRTALPGGTRDLRPGLRGVVRDVPVAAVFVEWANHVHLADAAVRCPAPACARGAGAARALPAPCRSERAVDRPACAQVVWGQPARPEWGQALEVAPRTVHSLSVQVPSRPRPCRVAPLCHRRRAAVCANAHSISCRHGDPGRQGLTVHDESAHPRTDAPAGPGAPGAGGLAARVLDWAHGVRANLRAGHSAFLSMRENAAAGVQARARPGRRRLSGVGALWGAVAGLRKFMVCVCAGPARGVLGVDRACGGDRRGLCRPAAVQVLASRAHGARRARTPCKGGGLGSPRPGRPGCRAGRACQEAVCRSDCSGWQQEVCAVARLTVT